MDYKIGLYLKGLILILIIKSIKSEFDRDILLTPRHSLQVNGRILYFRPYFNENISKNDTDKIPWEQALKHVTFLTLNNHLDDTTDLNALPDYRKFMNASYLPTDLYIPKFGDIITLAKGRLEKNFSTGNIQFIEGLCNDNCDPKQTLAFWQVEKIRHRDTDKNFRYEIRLTVNTKMNSNKNYNDDQNSSSFENDSVQSETRNSELISERRQKINNSNVKRSERTPRILRSFILKDNDYPNSFSFLDEHLLKRHNIATRTAYLDKLNAFNDIFTHPRYYQTRKHELENDYSKLNIGEYIVPTRKPYSIDEYTEPINRFETYRPFIGTTFRPNYNQKFSVPNNFQYPYQFENPQHYSYTNYQNQQIKSKPPQYEIPPYNPRIVHQTRKPFDETRNPLEIQTYHNFYNTQQTNEQSNHYTFETASASPSYSKDHTSTIRLIEQPLNNGAGIKSPFSYRTPPSVINQIPIPPSQAPINYHFDTTYPGTAPSSIQGDTDKSYFQEFNEDKTEENSSDNSKSTYSSPDPIYHPESQSSSFEDSTKYDQHDSRKTNTPSNKFQPYNPIHYDNKPDSINAQLPPPEEGQDVKVPYVEKQETGSVVSQSVPEFGEKTQPIFVTTPITTSTKLTKTQEKITIEPITTTTTYRPTKTRGTPVRIGRTSKQTAQRHHISTSTTVKPIGIRIKQKLHRSTTERPVLKWKSKRAKITREYPTQKAGKPSSTSSKYEFEKIHVDERSVTLGSNITATRNSSKFKFKDIPTKKSVATSITYKIGKDKLQKPFKPTVKIPNVEIVEANLVKLPTSNHRDIKIFKATEELNEKFSTNSKEEVELTETIVDHARNL